jgi:hypothetical protein
MTDVSDTTMLSLFRRLEGENPKAFAKFIRWCSEPEHTQQITLRFQGHKFQLAERHETAR